MSEYIKTELASGFCRRAIKSPAEFRYWPEPSLERKEIVYTCNLLNNKPKSLEDCAAVKSSSVWDPTVPSYSAGCVFISEIKEYRDGVQQPEITTIWEFKDDGDVPALAFECVQNTDVGKASQQCRTLHGALKVNLTSYFSNDTFARDDDPSFKWTIHHDNCYVPLWCDRDPANCDADCDPDCDRRSRTSFHCTHRGSRSSHH